MRRLFLLSMLSACPSLVLAATLQEQIETATQLFAKGSYASARDLLAGAKLGEGSQAEQAMAHYLVALSDSKLQNFDSAIKEFSQASAVKANDYHYNYGQALFSAQKFPEAQREFKRSIVQKYKIGASAYYIAYIAQISEDDALARDFYTRIQRMAEDKDEVKQASLLQLAELDFSQAQEDKNNEKKSLKLQKRVVPAFENARDFTKDTPIAEQASHRLEDVEKIIDGLAPKMRNGTAIPKKAYNLKLSQETEYDSNVTTQGDQSTTAISNHDSMILRPDIYARYQINIAQIVSLLPEVNFTTDYHTRRDQALVYQNDSITMAPALRTKTEHMAFGSAATMLVDLESSYMLRDYQQTHTYKYYNRYVNLAIGERLRYFTTGTTSLKFGYKDYQSQDNRRNAYIPSMTLSQSTRIQDGFILQNSYTMDRTYSQDDFYDEKNYKLSSSTNFKDAMGKWDLNPSLAVSIKDTMKQKGSRGNEVTLNPSLETTRDISKIIDLSIKYAYTRTWSRDTASYQYKKHVLTLGLNCTL